VITPQILKVVLGTSSFLGFISLIAYLYFVLLSNRAKRSIGEAIQGETLFNATQVLKILSQFHDDTSRLEALKTLTAYDKAKARDLLKKVEDNVDVQRVSNFSEKYSNKAALMAAVFFLALAALAFAYQKAKADTAASGHSPSSSVGEPPRKILTQVYALIANTPDQVYESGPFAGQTQASYREISRSEAEVVPGETYWMPPPNQMVPAETLCKFGPSAGNACSLDANLRLSAYIRRTCGEEPIEGNKVSTGCSRASPLFDPAHPPAPIIQCCFYQASPAARGLPFNHDLVDWYGLEVAKKK
jgi:hypothetical protein